MADHRAPGKFTLLRMVAGLETINSGEVQIAGKVVNNKEPMDCDIAMVFQNYAPIRIWRYIKIWVMASSLQDIQSPKLNKKFALPQNCFNSVNC